MDIRDISMQVDGGGLSQAVAISGTSAPSTALTFAAGNGDALVHPTVDCFVRRGAATPVALANGTDMFLPGGCTVRLSGIPSGQMLAFITGGATGTVYITPSA